MKLKVTKGLLPLAAATMLGSCTDKVIEKPNILFIMSDDHTSQAWGIYGGVLKNHVKNTNIKKIANEGVTLTNCFCTNSICVPSRASILTGQYSHKNNVFNLTNGLNPQKNNIAKIVKKVGYQTALVGKWHLKKQPSGFDYFSVLPDQGRYWDPLLKTSENWLDGHKGGKVHKGFSTDVITDLSLQWLKNRDKTKPFMLMTHFKATHEPFDYPARYNNLYKGMTIPEPSSFLDWGKSATGRTFKGQQLENLGWRWKEASKAPDKWWCKYPDLPFTTDGLDSLQARKKIYQKFIKDFMRCGAAIDDNIGRLLDYLKEEKIADNTIIIYTADQGYFLGEHGFFDKRMIYEESMRMPFVIRYPKEIKGGQKIDDIILNIDFASLIADYAGAKQTKEMQGASFRDNLSGKTPANWRKSMYYRYWEHAEIRPGHFGIRNSRYKLAFFYGLPLDKTYHTNENTEPAWEFFDLQKDPNELHNAYNDNEYSKIIKDMKSELLELRSKLGDTDKQYPEMKKVMDKHWN